MLLEHLYKISLERPEYWAMWIGLPPSCHKMLDIRIELLGSYINGFRVSRELSNQDEIESDHFSDGLSTKSMSFRQRAGLQNTWRIVKVTIMKQSKNFGSYFTSTCY